MTCRVGIVRRGIARLTRVTHDPCVCRSSFASDAHQSHVPTSSEVWKAGNVFQTLWDAICLKNYALFQGHDQYRHNIRTAVFWNFVRSCRVPASKQSQCRSNQTCIRVATSFPRPRLYLFQARLYHEDTARDTKLRRHVPFNKHTNNTGIHYFLPSNSATMCH